MRFKSFQIIIPCLVLLFMFATPPSWAQNIPYGGLRVGDIEVPPGGDRYTESTILMYYRYACGLMTGSLTLNILDTFGNTRTTICYTQTAAGPPDPDFRSMIDVNRAAPDFLVRDAYMPGGPWPGGTWHVNIFDIFNNDIGMFTPTSVEILPLDPRSGCGYNGLLVFHDIEARIYTDCQRQVECSIDPECDDGNPDTVDTCDNGICTNINI